MAETSVSHDKWTHEGYKVRILKCIAADGASHGQFAWPGSGPVEAPDWDPAPIRPQCDGSGGGLFGWAWGVGVGDGREADYNPATSRWLVLEADPAEAERW